jgi:CubicO group peptidase (beta-lactamase class C family)
MFGRILLWGLGLLCLAGAGFYLSDKTYFDRYVQLAYDFATTGGQLEKYDPVEPIAGAGAPFASAEPATKGLSPAAITAARAYAASTKASAFLIWRDGALVEESYFGGNARDKPIISRSLAKPFMAAAIGRAIALGAVRSLDQPVADFITEWKDDPVRSKILVRHLLDNRTGFLGQDPAYDPFDIRNRAYLHPHHEKILVEEYPITDPPPGSRYDYSQANGDFVAIVIERATKRRYAEFLSTELFKPIGAIGGTIWVNRPGGVAHSGCCMELPAEDFLRLGVLFLQDGVWDGRRLLPEGFVAEMRKGTPQNPHAGLSVYIAGPYVQRRGFANPDGRYRDYSTLHAEPYLAADLFLFDGNNHQVVYIIPSAKMVVLRTGRETPDEPEFDNTILPNTLLRGLTLGPKEAPIEPQTKTG